MLEKTLESPLDCKEIQPVQPKGDQPWMFIGRTDAKAETPVLWPPQPFLIFPSFDAEIDNINTLLTISNTILNYKSLHSDELLINTIKKMEGF